MRAVLIFAGTAALAVAGPIPAYTQESGQIVRGVAVYRQNCAACHGVSLNGAGGPSLLVAGFEVRYPSADSLFDQIQTTMPQTAPGSLTDEQYWDLTAFILQRRGVDYPGELGPENAAEIVLPPSPELTPPPSAPPPAVTARPTALPTPGPSGNTPPLAPSIWEPRHTFRGASPYFLNFQTAPFQDLDEADRHLATRFEIWDLVRDVRVWTMTATDPIDQASLLSGEFEGILAGKLGLEHKRVYSIRARHLDDSGDPETEWSAWSPSVRILTSEVGRLFPKPMRLRDVQEDSFSWVDINGAPVRLQPGNSLLLTGGRSHFLLVEGTGAASQVTELPPVERYVSLILHFRAGASELLIPESTLTFLDGNGVGRRIYIPFMKLDAGRLLNGSASTTGEFYFEPDDIPVGEENFEPLLFGGVTQMAAPWRLAPGFRLELVTNALTLPVQMALVPNPGNDPAAPFMYVTEFRGGIKAIARDGTTWTYADNVAFQPPELAPPSHGSGQLGLSGIAVDPLNGDLYVTTVYFDETGGQNKIVRLESDDGGRTAARQSDVLRLEGEITRPSHQIHGIIFGHDGKLYVAVGNGFFPERSQDDDAWGGKILRLNRDGTAPADNPYFDPDRPDHPVSYQWAAGIRNVFALAQRPGDDAVYAAMNGPQLDSLLRIEAGSNLGYNGTDESVLNAGLWYFGPPGIAPTGTTFVLGGVFPDEFDGRLLIGSAGPDFVRGPTNRGKEIWSFELAADGFSVEAPTIFMKYVGTGHATISGLVYGPDGLYFAELFADHPPGNEADAGSAGARIWRIVPDVTAALR